MQITSRIKFDVIKRTARKTVMVDGKKRQRQRTFEETLNPFNKNPDGSVKTPADIQASLAKKCQEWKQTTDG